MAFDNVPWFVEGGALHSAQVARILAYIACGGHEGILNSTDLAVLALATPGTSIRVMPGACTILNRALGAANEAYVGRAISETNVAIQATTAGGPRSDLIIARVENPHIGGEPWSMPGDVTVGPYIFPRVIQNVTNTTTKVNDLALGYSAITLARIDIPVSTATITQSMIKDLRSLMNPVTGPQPPPDTDDGECDETDPVIDLPCGSGNDDDNDTGDQCTFTATTYINWPLLATWTVKIPKWATHYDATIEVQNCQIRHGSLGGLIRLLIGATQQYERNWRCDRPSSSNIRQSLPLHGRNVPIPSNLRGTVQTFKVQTKCNGGFGVGMLLATPSTRLKATIKFKQKAS